MRASWQAPLLVAAGTTVVVTALAHLLPEHHTATGVGMAFLAATYLVVLRGDDDQAIRHCGLALGGLLERAPLRPRQLLLASARALAWTALSALVCLPPFWLGYLLWYQPDQPFWPASPPALGAEVMGQLLVIALPEEAFYRGYLQTRLDDAWGARFRLLGATVGPGLVVSAAIFALGHLATEVHPNRLAVFFPALLFGWLRARTGGIGSALLVHASFNLFASYLARSYGFAE
jgi:membrane protease YdiL (CAAX protease family)